MLSAFLLMTAAAPQAAATTVPAPVSSEIAVIRKRLTTWRGTTKKKGNAFFCKTRKSSGDKVLDGIRCDAQRYCMAQIDGSVQAVAALDLSRSARDARIDALAKTMTPCLETYEDARVAKLARERAGV